MAKLYPSSTHGHKLLVSLKSESVLRPVTLSVKGKGPCHPTKQDEGLESAPRTRWPLPRRCQHPDPSMMPCLTSTSCVATPARQAPSAAPPSAQSRPEPRCLPAMFSRLPRAPVQVLRAQGADAQSYRVTDCPWPPAGGDGGGGSGRGESWLRAAESTSFIHLGCQVPGTPPAPSLLG